MSYVPGFAVRSFGSWASRLSSLRRQAVGSLLLLMVQASWAVSDLPGGPAVRQLDLHPPATRIAAELGVSEITVKVHRRRVMEKMQVRSVAELVRAVERLTKHQPVE